MGKNLALASEGAQVNRLPHVSDALAHFMEKIVNIREQERHFMGQHSLHSCQTSLVTMRCTNKACFQLDGTSWWGDPEQKVPISLQTCPFRRPRENWDTHISCPGVSLPTYRLTIIVRPREKNGKNTQDKKNHALPFAIFFPFRFKIIRTYWKIIHAYPSHLWSLTSYL